jgi:hypothetical protein
MKDFIIKGILLTLGILLISGCHDNDLIQQSTVGAPVDVVLDFGTTNHEQVQIKTRTTYDLYYESMVRNVYVFVFANNSKIYGHYFNEANLDDTASK